MPAPPVLYVETGRGGLSPPFHGFADLRSCDQDAVAIEDIERARGVILPMYVDQRRFARWAADIERWIAAGGRLFLSGNTAYPIVPGLAPFCRLPQVSPPFMQIARAAEHPVFDSVPPERQQANSGVQGFYGRGHVPPLPGATIIRTIDGGRVPIDWEKAWPGRGRLLVHAGNDPWTTGDDPEDRRRFARALVTWLGDSA